MSSKAIQDLRQFIKEHPFPTDILVETNTACNLDCVMCPQSDLTREKGAMDMELWRKIVREVAAVSPATRLWPALMGEPLLLGDRIFEMIRYATDKGVPVYLNSNLNLFTPDMADNLFSARPTELLIDVDAATAATYETIRRKGDFSRLVESIHFLLDEKARRGISSPRIVLQFITMQENMQELQDFIAYWKATQKDVLLKVKPRTGWANAVDCCYQDDYDGTRDIPCTWLLRQMTILWNGLVPQCDGDWNGITCMGDINRQSIAEVWSGALKTLRDRHLRLEFDPPLCHECQDWAAGRATWVRCGEGE